MTFSPLERDFLTFQRHRFMDAVWGVPDLFGEAGFGALRELICESGTDCLRHFGNGYLLEGGLALQQNPDEFAALCLFLKQQGPFPAYLEIGSASGGTGLFLSRQLGFDLAMSIDDGEHSRAAEQKINLAGFKGFVGSSHSAEAAAFLAATLMGRPLDLAFVDGDHTEEGVWKDIQMVRRFSAPGTLIVLHDTKACPGVEIAWLRAAWEGILTPLAEFIGDLKPLGIGVGRVN